MDGNIDKEIDGKEMGRLIAGLMASQTLLGYFMF